MSPVYLNPQHSSSMSFLDQLKGDQYHHNSLPIVRHLHDHAASNNVPFFLHSNLENHHNSAAIRAIDCDYSRFAQEKVEKMVLSQVTKANDLDQLSASPQQKLQYATDGSGCSYTYRFDHRDHQNGGGVNYTDQNNRLSKKCKQTKLRIMQKMTTTSNKSKIGGDHQHDKLHHYDPVKTQTYRNISGSESTNVRVCTDCHTTTTPLWRSGPQGPKSLCNACGIRQRKARQAAMAAAELAKNATVAPPSPMSSPSLVENPKPKHDDIMRPADRKPDHNMNHTLPIKKRSKMISNDANWNYNSSSQTGDTLSFEDLALSSSKNCVGVKSQRVFPRDEEEGAILLMALSCGLACSS